MTTRREFCLALCGAASLRGQDEPVFTALARDVRVDAAVMQSQRPVTGLRADNFLLFDNGQPQAIRSVTTEELPLDLVLILDTIPNAEGIPSRAIAAANRIAESMKARLLNGAANVLKPTRPEDRVALLTHSSPPRIELPFTNDRNAMAAALRRVGNMEHSAGFSLLLTVEYAVRMLAELTRANPAAAKERRRSIVRLGSLTGSGLVYADEPVIRRLWSENIIYSSIEILYPGGGFNPGFRTPDEGAIGTGSGWQSREPDGPLYRISNPNHIAAATGGDALRFLNPKDPEDLITRMRQRYVLWFRQPEGLNEGQERKISVELSPEIRRRYSDAVVQARTGYVTR